MRILVLSDTHGGYAAAELAIEKQHAAEHVIFLGDGLRSFYEIMQLYPNRVYHTVRGNCDFGSSEKTSDLLDIGGRRIFFTHGHTYNVKYGLSDIKRAARERSADLLLFGHTHAAFTGYEDGLYIMNPGSIEQPRTGSPTYGLIDITDAGMALNVIEVR